MVVLVIALWIGAFFLTTSMLPTWTERGQFGDLFGAVNSLFSGLAFAGLFYTIFLQRQELSLQRTELELQRLEMKGSREQLASQAEAQHSLFLANVAQVRVAEMQAEIEATKVRAAGGLQSNAYAGDIRALSQKIAEIANGLETNRTAS